MTPTSRLVRQRTLLPSRQRMVDEDIRDGARVLAFAGVGAIAALPFVVTAAFGG